MECATFYALGHGFLQLLRILLSWPPVFLAACLVMSKRFRNGIRSVLSAIAKSIRDGKTSAKVGAFEIQMDANRQRSDAPASDGAADEALTGLDPSAKAAVPDSPRPTGEPAIEVENNLRAEVEHWKALAAANAVSFLEVLLAPKTKSLLYYLRDQGTLPTSMFNLWVTIISEGPHEEAAIYAVTQQHSLIEVQEGTVSAGDALGPWIEEREKRGNPPPPPLATYIRKADVPTE